MISNLVNKELLEFQNNINILSSRPEDKTIVLYIKNTLDNCNIINFDDTYYGNLEPNIVLCNNRIMDLIRCVDMAKFFHVPLMIIDSEPKSMLVTNKIDNTFDFSPVVQIALSKEIFYSWNRIHDYTLNIEKESNNVWKNIIYNLCKEKFKLKNTGIINNENIK